MCFGHLYLDWLPYNVTECPEICVVEVVRLYQKYTVRVTDAWGKEWYIRTAGKNHYDWTRSRIWAKEWTEQTAQKHADSIGKMVMELVARNEGRAV